MKLAKTNGFVIEASDKSYHGSDWVVWIMTGGKTIATSRGKTLVGAMQGAIADANENHVHIDSVVIDAAWKSIKAYETPNPYRDPAEQEEARMEKEHYANA